jgi:hypothetical protein
MNSTETFWWQGGAQTQQKQQTHLLNLLLLHTMK